MGKGGEMELAFSLSFDFFLKNFFLEKGVSYMNLDLVFLYIVIEQLP